MGERQSRTRAKKIWGEIHSLSFPNKSRGKSQKANSRDERSFFSSPLRARLLLLRCNHSRRARLVNDARENFSNVAVAVVGEASHPLRASVFSRKWDDSFLKNAVANKGTRRGATEQWQLATAPSLTCSSTRRGVIITGAGKSHTSADPLSVPNERATPIYSLLFYLSQAMRRLELLSEVGRRLLQLAHSRNRRPPTLQKSLRASSLSRRQH